MMLTIEDSFATLQAAVLPAQVHQQCVCCLCSAAKINTIVIVPIEPLTRQIPAARATRQVQSGDKLLSHYAPFTRRTGITHAQE